MAKAFGGKRPQNLRHTLRRFGDYLGHHKRKLALIGVLTSISALAALIGTYMIRPAVNGILENGSLAYLAGVVAFTAFVYLIGAVAYTFFFDVPGFRHMMRFVMITYSVTLIIYFLFPTCQMLRPEVFPRDNALTRFIAGFYVFDTNTNVCPSLHVIGSMAAFFAFWYAPIFSKRGWRIASTAAAFFISISTVFMKQHSILDVAAAIPLCAIGYYFAYVRTPKKSRSAAPDVTR